MTFESEWARCAPWLEVALRRSSDGFRLDDVLADVWAHKATFWPGKRAAMVTEPWQGPDGVEANVWVAGGDLRSLLAMAPLVEAKLKSDGYCAVSILGRPGWARALRALGYVRQGEELRKVL